MTIERSLKSIYVALAFMYLIKSYVSSSPIVFFSPRWISRSTETVKNNFLAKYLLCFFPSILSELYEEEGGIQEPN